MYMEGKRGVQNIGAGGVGTVRLNGEGGVVASLVRGTYGEAAVNGRLFYAANQTPIATSTTLNTTFTGLGLCNPSGSGKLYIVHEFGYAIVKAAAGEGAIALATSDSTGFAAATAIVVRCARNAFASSSAIVTASATIAAPIIVKVVGTIGQGADTTQLMPPPTLITLGGSIVLAEGRSLVTDTTVASGATTIQFSFMWEEIDAG